MPQKSWLIEIKNKEGVSLLAPFYLYMTELAANGESHSYQQPTTKVNGSNNGKEEDLMTEAQKKLLFRLMAQAGFEGDAATQEIKKRLTIQSLKEATKQEASNLIQELLEETKS